MSTTTYTIEPIGFVSSELTQLEAAPLQGDEGAPEAWLELTSWTSQGLTGITAGDELIVLTWLHLARRDALQVHPRGRPDAPLRAYLQHGHQIVPTLSDSTGFRSCRLLDSIYELPP